MDLKRKPVVIGILLRASFYGPIRKNNRLEKVTEIISCRRVYSCWVLKTLNKMHIEDYIEYHMSISKKYSPERIHFKN